MGTSSGRCTATSYFKVLRTLVVDVLRTSVGDVPWCYIEDHMGTSIGRFLETSSIRPQDVSLPSGHSTKKAYININSLLSKKDKIRFIANKDEAAITGITESNHTVPDLEVNLPGYDILRCDRNRNSGGVACYIRKDLCFNT